MMNDIYDDADDDSADNYYDENDDIDGILILRLR